MGGDWSPPCQNLYGTPWSYRHIIQTLWQSLLYTNTTSTQFYYERERERESDWEYSAFQLSYSSSDISLKPIISTLTQSSAYCFTCSSVYNINFIRGFSHIICIITVVPILSLWSPAEWIQEMRASPTYIDRWWVSGRTVQLFFFHLWVRQFGLQSCSASLCHDSQINRLVPQHHLILSLSVIPSSDLQ